MEKNHTHKLELIDWAAWTPDTKLNTTSIPSGIKRRCSHLSKMALEVSNQMLTSHAIDYAVFCSQHGELERTVGLLRDIADETILSPMSFAQSVHNTAAGLFSVIHKLSQNITSIAAGANTFFMGIIDAATWLELNPGKTVLLTIFDQHIPDAYASLNIQSDYEYAVSLLLTNNLASTSAISLILDYTETQKLNNKLPPALEFLSWLQSEQPELIQNTGEQKLRWCRK